MSYAINFRYKDLLKIRPIYYEEPYLPALNYFFFRGLKLAALLYKVAFKTTSKRSIRPLF